VTLRFGPCNSRSLNTRLHMYNPIDIYYQSRRAGTHGVAGHFFFRKLGTSLACLYTNKRDTHLFCSCRSLNTSVSDAGKRVVDYAAAYYVEAVDRLSSNTPCLFAIVRICEELGGLEKQLTWQRAGRQPYKAKLRCEAWILAILRADSKIVSRSWHSVAC
jgi:hypothetical protein